MKKPNEVNALIGEALPAIVGCVRNLESNYHQRNARQAKIELVNLIRVASRSLLEIEKKEQGDETDSATR